MVKGVGAEKPKYRLDQHQILRFLIKLHVSLLVGGKSRRPNCCIVLPCADKNSKKVENKS